MKRLHWEGRGLTGRQAAAGVAIVVGLGRLGVYAIGPTTELEAAFYGWLLLLAGVGLLATGGVRRFHFGGRMAAALAAGVMAGMGFDVGTLNTSVVMLYWFAVVLLIEAGVRCEC